MFITEHIICNFFTNNKSTMLFKRNEETICQKKGFLFHSLQIACSLLRFWIIMLIVCSNWREIVMVLLIFSTRTNSPMTCFSMKYLPKNQNDVILQKHIPTGMYQTILLKKGWIMLVSISYQLRNWSQCLDDKILKTSYRRIIL